MSNLDALKDQLDQFRADFLRHRLIVNFECQAEGVQTDQVIENVLVTVGEPVAI